MGEQHAILLDFKDTCTPDTIAIRGGGRVGVLVRNWRWELRKKGRKSRFEGPASLTEPPKGRILPGTSHAKTPGQGRRRAHTTRGKMSEAG